MNYTEKYHLPQWEETDRIMRTDFNEAMANIENGITDTATAYAAGTYSGTGGWRKIVTGFRPRMLRLDGSAHLGIVRGEEVHSFLDHRALSGAFGPDPDSRAVTYDDDGFTVHFEEGLYPLVNDHMQTYVYVAAR
jgi:hypothetical protein